MYSKLLAAVGLRDEGKHLVLVGVKGAVGNVRNGEVARGALLEKALHKRQRVLRKG